VGNSGEAAAADVRRLRELVVQLTDLSQLESGSIELRPEDLSASDVVADVVAAAAPKAAAKGIELLTDVSDDLGLAIARQVARAHGRDVWVDSGPGPGAVFNLTLPQAQGRPAE
jgi:signal transduction histidine kinase